MKAMIYEQYGSPEVLHLKEVNKPTPKDNELLIRVVATAVNSGDVRVRKADPWAVRLFFGLLKPKKNILGGVFSGIVESTGKDVTKFKVGDEIFGTTGMNMGTYAEFVCVKENATLAIKPDIVSHEEAATIPFGGTTALHFLRKANIKKGQKVLVYGASGAVGSAAIQLARFYGAEVTGVCSSSNIEMVKSLGADKVIDYTTENVIENVIDNGVMYDVVFETVNKLSFSDAMHILSDDGTLLLASAMPSEMLLGAWVSLVSSTKVVSGVIKEDAAAIEFLSELIEYGNYRAVVDRSYPLEQMQAAHAYVDKGHKKGNVAIVVANASGKETPLLLHHALSYSAQ